MKRDVLGIRRSSIGSIALSMAFMLLLACSSTVVRAQMQESDGGGASGQQSAIPNMSPDSGLIKTPDVLKLGNKEQADAEDSDQQESESQSQADMGEPPQSALPPDRIIDLLQEHPEMMDQARVMVAKLLSKPANVLTEIDIDDETVFEQVQKKESLRISLTLEAKSRGYLSQAELESLGYSAPDTKAPRLRRRPQAQHKLPADKTKPVEQAKGPYDPNQPETAKLPNPYPSLPALQDLYQQIPSRKAQLARFGADIFKNGSGNTESLPADLPAGPDYVLGTGDGLSITLTGSVSRKLTATVDREGRIALPEAGGVMVAGYTLAEAQKLIQSELSKQFRVVTADVSLTRLRTVRVYVVGDVEKPGAYDISSLSSPLSAVYAAGGPTARGSLRSIRHLRGQQLVDELDLYQLLLRGISTAGSRLLPGDTILVPPVGPQVTVTGMVRRPAIYELRGDSGLSDVLELAGGVLVSATLRQINVERIEAHQRRVMLSAKIPDSDDKEALHKALGDFHVQDGDWVTVSPILPYSDKTVYLEGHVFRPGKYPYHDGIEVSELLRSYQDVLPEPSDRAEIVRLEPPDYRPTTIEFKLSEILSGEDPIVLKPFDTVKVYGRYENDAPKVSIYGEVLRPGKYPLTHEMTAADLVRMAGGFKRSALQARADVNSYVVQHGERIRTEHQTVEIAKALAGDKTVDVALKAGDVVTIHQLAGWRDIGAAMSLKGEVMYPGTYGIEEGETLSSLLKRAGGFRHDAYPEGAVLERVQVRKLAEKSRAELIERIQSGSSVKLPGAASLAGDPMAVQAALQQRNNILTTLKSQPASGRLVIKISSDIRKWRGTPNDIEVRAGDILTVPKTPNFVLISGQVYNPTAITYAPGRNTQWYLRQAGGPTQLANRKGIYVVRANGSVVGESSDGAGWWGGGIMSTVLRPGDTIVVPEKILAPSAFWKNALTTAQFMSSIALTAGVISTF